MSTARLRLATVLGSRWTVAAIIAVALAIALHSTATGFITDDHVFRALVHSTSERAPASWDLFRFAGGDPVTNAVSIRFGHSPWWTAPDFKIHFARPLTSLLFAADVHLFGDGALGYHLHSLVWFAGLLAAAAACLRRVLSRPAATLALAVFAWHAGHTQAYAWPSARHVLVAAVPALLSLYARLCGRRWLSLVLLLVAFAGSEMGLGIVPFLLAYEVAQARRTGPPATWRSAVVASWKHTLPIVVVTLVYLAAYHALGFGVAGGGGYHDPLGDPSGFLAVALPHALALLGDVLVEVPSEFAVGGHVTVLAAIGATATVIVGVVWRARTGRESRAVATGRSVSRTEDLSVPGAEPTAAAVVGPVPRDGSSAAGVEQTTGLACSATATGESMLELGWLVAGALGATVVATTGIPGGRVMTIAELGFAALFGALFAGALGLDETSAARPGWPTRIVIALLAVIHLVGAPVRAWRDIDRLDERGVATEIVAHEALELARGRRLFILAASDPYVFLYPRGVASDLEPGAIRCWSVLSAARTSHRLERVDDHTFTLTARHAPMLAGFDALFRRADRRFAIGDSVEQCGADITITELRDGTPSAITVHVKRRLDDPELVFASWLDGHLVPVDLRTTTELAWSPGPAHVL